VPLGPYALDVLFQLFLCDVYIDIMEMVERGQERHDSETGDGVALPGEEDGWYRGDEDIAENGIHIMPKDKLCEKGLVLAVVLRNFRVCGIVFV
jgi:hypothetical protein